VCDIRRSCIIFLFLSVSILSYPILSYPILFYSILSYPINAGHGHARCGEVASESERDVRFGRKKGGGDGGGDGDAGGGGVVCGGACGCGCGCDCDCDCEWLLAASSETSIAPEMGVRHVQDRLYAHDEVVCRLGTSDNEQRNSFNG